jgi:ABC-2 type transport system permease protein
MRNVWLVAWHEYKRVVLRRAFILTTLAVPLGMVLISVLAVVVANMQENNLPLGYVDHAGVVNSTLLENGDDLDIDIDIVAFDSEAAANEALLAEEIQAYYVLPADYLVTQASDLYYLSDPPRNSVQRDFESLVRASLAASYPPDVRSRLLDGVNVMVEDVVNGRVFDTSSPLTFIFPFAATFFFFISTMFASGYMLQVVADEKENRTIELMLTSMKPLHLIGGKAMGLLGAALSQLAIYVGAVAVGIAIARPQVVWLQNFQVPWGYLALMMLFFFPAYALISAIMVAIGSAITELYQGQQIAGLLNFLFIIPVMLSPLLFQNPSHPVLMAMTFFPTTAFLTISLRWSVTAIPFWQLAVSWGTLILTDVLVIWAASRIFRAGFLQYGQPLSIRSVWAALRES